MSRWTGSLDEALATARDKRGAAERLGVHAGTVRSYIEKHRPELMERWSALPAGGAFAGRRGVPMARPGQARADELVDEALADLAAAGWPLSPHNPQKHDVVRLVLQLYAITGSIALPYGWVRSTIVAMRDAGCAAPTPASVRWYRSKLSTEPDDFLDVPGVDPDLIADLAEDAYR